MPAPPPLLEKLVLALIPPQAREAVAGDLWETCANPRQYAREALRTVPFVIVSQVRRNLNLPVLALKLALAWSLLGAGALWLLPPLLLLDAWQPARRPDAHGAIRETMTIALAAMVIVQGLSMNVSAMLHLGLSRANWLSLYLLGFLVAPLLCLIRTGLILRNDRPIATCGGGPEDVRVAHAGFAGQARRHNIAEGIALLAAAVTALLLLEHRLAFLLTGLYLAMAVFLLLRGAPAPLPGTGDLRSLRAAYVRALARQRRLRHLLWWLWCMPLAMALAGRMQGPPLAAATSAAGLLLLCFLLGSINREDDGRVREEIGALEKPSG